MSENQVTRRPSTAPTIKERLSSDQFRNEIAKSLPKHLTPDRMLRTTLTCLTKTPKLAQCDQHSFFAALLTLSQLGLEPDGRRAHLIPYGTTCQLIVDYKGIVELVMRSGLVSNIHADLVCDRDEFEFDRGQLTRHKINFREPRGAVYAVYALCRFRDGSEKAEVMTIEEVEAIRERSKAGKSGPWVTDWNEMAKKTVFRRLSKWLPLSSEIRDAVEHDEVTIEAESTVKQAPKFRSDQKIESPKEEDEIQMNPVNYPKFIAKAMSADGITEVKLLTALQVLGKGDHSSLESLPAEIQEYVFDQWGTIVDYVKGSK